MDKLKIFAAVEKAIQKGQSDKALEGLEQILKSDPVELKALNRAADLYLKEENFEKAVEYLKRIGAVYSKDGFYSKAVAVYKRILKIDQITSKTTIMAVHEQLANLYGQLGLISDAMSHFSIVVDYYDQSGDQVALLEALKKVSDLDPNNIESQLKLCELLLAQNREAEAQECLDRLTETVNSKKSTIDMIRVYERASELFPKDTSRLQSVTELYIKANEPKKALAKIQVSFRADSRNPAILELLSMTFLAMKQPDKSKAVDVELIKLYRQNGDNDKIFAVESRIKGRPLVEKSTPEAQSMKASAPVVDEAVDPVESLIKALPLSTDEKKILSECEVYFKYGLAEKAYEVLMARLSQFPKSLILRWKLKNSTQELKKTDETVHLLSEIILLAKSQNMEIWANVAAAELKLLDSNHAALAGFVNKAAPAVPAPTNDIPKVSAKNPPASKKEKVAAAAEEFSFSDFENSEVSIVIDEELSEDHSEFSEISFQDLNPEQEKSKKNRLSEVALDLTEEVVEEPPTPALEDKSFEVMNDEPVESILSESDFTDDELNQLDGQLSSEDKTVKAEPTPSKKVAAVTGSEELSAPLDLEAYSDEKPEVLADDEFEIRQGIEEISFFRTQGLNDEAETLLKGLKDKFPHHKDWKGADARSSNISRNPNGTASANKLNKKVHEVETLGRKVKLSVQEDSRQEKDGDFFDLAGELDRELASGAQQAPAEIKEIFNAFKKGVSETISADDWQAHFDLGIAYREMGLYDDAIDEFTLVSQIAEQKVSALYQIGLTQMSMSKYQEAKNCFDQALKEPGMVSQEKLSVSYELGEVLLKLNARDKAKELFEQVKKIDPDFREVEEKIKALG
ncbi:MAG: hypothetical protein JWQ35_2348 [Bacteriovoracaceae bacterium]|nr:hypothetical protein [Bacteriovoracaceae bacterium]